MEEEEEENENIINDSSPKKNNINDTKVSAKMKYFKSFLKLFEDLEKKLSKNIKKANQLKNKYIKNIKDDDEKLKIITNKILEAYHVILTTFQLLFGKIRKKIKNYSDDFDQLEQKYSNFNEYKKILKNKDDNKKLLELKNNYHKNGKNLENLALITFDKEDLNTSEFDKLLLKTKESFNKYKNEVNEKNKLKKEYNNKLFEFNHIYNKVNKIFLYNSIKEEFNNYLEQNLKKISEVILDINIEKKLNPKKIEDIRFRNFNNFKSEDLEKIEHYPSIFIFEYCGDEKDYNTFVKAIKYIKKQIGDNNLYKDFDEEKEKIRNEKRIKIIPFFDTHKGQEPEINNENKKELINILKDSSIHRMFLSIMSKFRIYNEKNKEWIDLMGECLNIILDINFEVYNYDNIKNCIILSQTYYYIEEEKNEKIYLIKHIKDKEFLKDYNFWKKLTEIMIINQLENFKEMNDLKNIDILGEVQINNTIIKKLGDLLFTQILPYVNNMLDFNIDKNEIIEVVNYLNKKFKYLNKNDYNTIISVIKNRNK